MIFLEQHWLLLIKVYLLFGILLVPFLFRPHYGGDEWDAAKALGVVALWPWVILVKAMSWYLNWVDRTRRWWGRRHARRELKRHRKEHELEKADKGAR